MLREQIRKDIAGAVSSLEIEVTRSADSQHGDFSTNIALKVTKSQRDKEPKYKQRPMEFAKVLSDSLQNLPYIKKLEVKEPGFINFFIKDDYWQNQVGVVLKSDTKYGSNSRGTGKKARVEFVSANPTGPLHFGNARGGPIGDVLASVLQFSGYKVIREYYHNNVGEQTRKLGESILNVIKGKNLKDQEYKGEYILDLAKQIETMSFWKKSDKYPELTADLVGNSAMDILLNQIISDTRAMGIIFDKLPYRESSFIARGKTKSAINQLSKSGFIKEKDGALWFAPNDEFLKDRETVVVKSDGEYTYFANDIAYHNLKFTEGAELVIDILGANHHGHVPRLKAAVKALGFDADKFRVILYQWVRFKRGGQIVKMSKRAGTFLTAREVLDEVGVDALRFFILMHDASTHMDFDLELAKKRSSKNPVYYVQYAHARICSILTKTNAERLTTNVNYQLLTSNYELDLIKQITRLPELVADIAGNFAVHQLTSYARELADSFHQFYENCPVLTADDDLKSARLSLCRATQIALVNTLRLLGVTAPEKM